MHEMLGPQMPVELLIFADDLEAIASSAGGRRGITLSFREPNRGAACVLSGLIYLQTTPLTK